MRIIFHKALQNFQKSIDLKVTLTFIIPLKIIICKNAYLMEVTDEVFKTVPKRKER